MIPCLVFASNKLHFDVLGEKIYQGSLVRVKFKLNLSGDEKVLVKNIEGQLLDKIIYVNQILPVNGNSEGTVINGEASIIFLKVPEKEILTQKITGIDLEVTWSQVEIIPTESSESLLFGEFNVSSEKNFFKWIVIGSIVFLIIIFLFLIWSYWSKRRDLSLKKKGKLKIKDDLLSPKNYDDVVNIWKIKYDILKVFPNLEIDFKNLEEVLFKHQFKERRTKLDEEEVLEAYKKFSDSIQGGIDGV
jgi:hypothetical protein